MEKTLKYQQILVRDDLIPEYLQDYFELITLGINVKTDRSTVGEMFQTIGYKCKYEPTAIENKNIKPPLSFVHVLKDSVRLSTNFPNFSLIPLRVCLALNIDLEDVLMARVLLICPQDTKLKHYAPHTDLSIPHSALIYYVNDSDGATVLFDDDKNIIQEVEPKRGRILLFNGSIYHGGGIPKNSARCLVNFDINFSSRRNANELTN
jgi:hypothetical protein